MRRWPGGGVAIAALALGAASACVTSGEGAKMRAEQTAMRKRLETMESRGAEIDEQVARLRMVLDQATELLARNSADVGAKTAKNETDIAAMTGKLEELRHDLSELKKALEIRVASLEDTQTKLVDRVAPTIPDDKEQLWREAQTRMAEGQRNDARRFLRSFIQRFPTDGRAAMAQIAIGKSFAEEAKHTQAAAEYQRVLDLFPKAPEVPEAMWLLGQAFVELKFCSDAKVLFDDLAKRFPKAAQAAQAKARVKDLQKIVKNKTLCTS